MYILLKKGFTLVELMIVIAIIGILAGSLYPVVGSYLSRGRDSIRITNIKDLSATFQQYLFVHEIYPSNTDALGLVTSYCVTEIMGWTNAISLMDKQFTDLGGATTLRKDPLPNHSGLGLCTDTGSYFYARVWKGTGYSVMAARMENQTTGANWSGATTLTSSGYLDQMKEQKPLDKSENAVDKIFVLVTE